jgi:hypothetical protein
LKSPRALPAFPLADKTDSFSAFEHDLTSIIAVSGFAVLEMEPNEWHRYE